MPLRWESFCAELIKDTWGKPYQVIISEVKERGDLPLLTRQLADVVLHRLFPSDVARGVPGVPTATPGSGAAGSEEEEEEPEWITGEEVSVAVTRLSVKKAPGLDGVPIVAMKDMANLDIHTQAAPFTTNA